MSKQEVLGKNRNPPNWNQKCFIWVLWNWNLKKLLSYLKSASFNWSKRKVLCKTKKNQVCDQNLLLWIVLGCNFDKVIVIWFQHSRNCQNVKLYAKKPLNLLPKMLCVSLFWAGISKSIVIFKIITLELVTLEKFVQN